MVDTHVGSFIAKLKPFNSKCGSQSVIQPWLLTGTKNEHIYQWKNNSFCLFIKYCMDRNSFVSQTSWAPILPSIPLQFTDQSLCDPR